jgi:hypothetical protein
LKFSAGKAYDEFYGSQSSSTPVSPPGSTPQQRRPIPGIPGGMAELQNGRWIRVQ